ncbi:hypothetical protein C5E45_14670 [Nocardia nova]|uniref:SnoaL-like domain-containing protein n=1 Tax=Nocardia nova TaxID=37330 RepID=A0A2S6AQ59_9NOCA|nr:nuclear transport factor 2 family protein [Nocardia nova]PPJ26575.1 hypothetical protein C5E41_17360 [Nocardia nova]PPJ37375.1 hypothetical protein C5E45_14670 [Nocardia nova]
MNDTTAEDERTATITTLLARFSSGGFDEAMDLFSEDVEMRLPFQDTSTGFWSEVDGKKGLMQLFASIPRLFDTHPLYLDSVVRSTDSRTLVARYHGDFTVRKTGKPYRNTYIAVFEFADDKIRSWTEFHNPQILAEALRP